MPMPFATLRERFWARVERNPRSVVLFCFALSLVFGAVVCWRAVATLNERRIATLQHGLEQTTLGVAAVMDHEYRRLETLQQLGKSLLASQIGKKPVPPDSVLKETFAARNRPVWSMPLSDAGTSLVGFGPAELSRFPQYVRTDDTLMSDLYIGRSISRVLEVMVSAMDLESSGRFISRNGFYVAVPPDSIEPHRWLERIASMPYYRDAMPDRNPDGRTLRSPVYPAITTGEPTFSISAPVYLGNQFRGAVVLDVNQRILGGFLSELPSGSGGRVLFSGDGDVIASSDPVPAIGKKWPRDFSAAWRHEDPATLLARGAGEIDADGVRLLYRRVGDTDLVLAEEVSDAEVTRALFSRMSWALPGTIVVCGLLLSVTLAVISRLFVRFVERGEALRALAEQDPLTGLANRRVFQSRFLLERERRARSGAPLSMLMIDIDHFKRINDTWGHANGDRVLVALAQGCRATLRAVDLCARIGGEEFAVLLPDVGLDEGVIVAGRLRLALSALRVEAVADGHWSGNDADRNIAFTVSVGVAEMGADRVEGLDALLEVADRRLYRAKAEGRNRVVATDGQASAEVMPALPA